MRLTPLEEERLLIFSAAELARRHRAAGLLMNAPEAIALMCDAMLEAARAGSAYAAVEAAGLAAVAPDEVIPGVRELIDIVSLEVLLGDGTRLIVLVDPLGRGAPPDPTGPGALVPADVGDPTDAGNPADARSGDVAAAPIGGGRISTGDPADAGNPADAGDRPWSADPSARLERRSLEVHNTSLRVVRVSSHFPFDRVNHRLEFDREAAKGYRLDLEAGSSERWAPGEVRTVTLVRFGGSGGNGGTEA
jgi:urease subunit gamma/beta